MSDKYVLFDMPNTLFDSRHRTGELDYHITDIAHDSKNFSAFQLLRLLHMSGYKVILTHYCLSRLRSKVELLLERNHLTGKYCKLYTNVLTQNVVDNDSLKKHLYQTILSDLDLAYVVDNTKSMEPYWLQQEVALIQVPLSIL